MTMTKIKKIKQYIAIKEIFELFYKEHDTVLLESSLVNSLGEYSIIGRKPYLKIEKNNKDILVNGVKKEIEFETYVKKYLLENFQKNDTNLPLIAGAIGYFSYDYKRKKEDDIPESILIFYDQFIIEEHTSKSIYVVANGKTQKPESAIREIESLLCRQVRKQCQTTRLKVCYDFEREEYLKAIEKIINYIIEGDIYIANMTQRLFLESNLEPYDLYRILRLNNPSPFAAYMNYESFQVVCTSPERFMKVKNHTIVTRPIKGTRKRGSTEEEDFIMKKELENSEKDKSELLMIVDLERNDLNKICEPGSVKVDNLFSVESYATVHHLVAEVSGILKRGIDIIDIINATFPGGSITGAPKQRAMEIIEELEHTNRGLYTGTIGYFSLNGDCDMNIVIRTAIYKNGNYTLGVGGGITYESDISMEYEETLQKAKAFIDALS